MEVISISLKKSSLSAEIPSEFWPDGLKKK
jgi:hypothetical protein